MKTSTKVIITVLAVIMALAMMLPSFASVISSNRQAEEQEEQSQVENASDSSQDEGSADENATDDAQADATEGVPDNDDLKSLATQYSTIVSSLEARLDDDPDNLAALLNLAQNYMSWGYSAVSQSTTDEERDYANGLLDQAISYFDRYLELNDANSARVDRALCLYYQGDTDGAIAALEQISEDSPDFAPAWANLGMLYENQGDTDKAKEAYRQASETDPDDEYGAKSFADRRLVLITASEGTTDDTTSVVSGEDSGTEQGLTDTLADQSGTSF